MLLYKTVPHNFEVHFEDKLFYWRPVQFLNFGSDHLTPSFKDVIRNYESAVFYEWWGETYNTNKAADDFSNLVLCEFKSFFKEISIDTPRCFSDSHSLKREVNKYETYKLNNYIMRSGKSMKTYLLVTESLRQIHLNNYTQNLTSWLVVYNLLSSHNASTYNTRLPDNIKTVSSHNRFINEVGMEYSDWSDQRIKLIDNLKLLEPMFLFYIYKVDKNIYKNSRGRLGKFTFLWKYVAPYKRRRIVMAWLAKEIKMQSGRDFYSRVNSVIHNLVNKPSDNFIFKVRKFSYNYVYYNCRKTLAETYRTSTK